MATRNEMPSFKVLNFPFPSNTETAHAVTPYREAFSEPVGPGVTATISRAGNDYKWQGVKLAILEKGKAAGIDRFFEEREPRGGSPEEWERKFNAAKIALASDAITRARQVGADDAKKCIKISSLAMEARSHDKIGTLRKELKEIK